MNNVIIAIIIIIKDVIDINIKPIILDINKKNDNVLTTKKGDGRSRFLFFKLLDKSVPLDLTEKKLICYLVKPDSKKVLNHLVVNDAKKGYCTLELTNQVLAAAGVANLELMITKEDKKLTTIPLKLEVVKYLKDGFVESTHEFNALMDCLASVEAWDKAFEYKSGKLEELYTTRLNGLDVSLENKVSFKVESNGGEGVGGGYVHPETHPYSILTGAPTKLSDFMNDIGVGGGAITTTTTTNTLDQYQGATLNEKMVNMFNDLNSASKRYLPMEILLPSGIIEVTQDLKAIKWKNKVFRCSGTIVFKNCNAIEFVQCQHNDIFVNRVASVAPDNVTGSGLIDPMAVASLTKRGVKLTDFSYNTIRINTFVGFTNAWELCSEYGALGTFYNNIYFTDIWRCQRPMVFKTGKANDDTAIQSGWITEIFVHGGKFDCDDGVLVGQEVANRPQNEPTDNYQGIKFYNLGIEHVRKKENGVGIYFLQGKNNAVINPRFEGSLKTGNPTSGAYILVKESGYACLNKIETSNYPINVDRVQLNFLAMQIENPKYHNFAGSYITGCLMDNADNRLGFKAIATPGKMMYEAYNMNSYFFTGLKNNTFIYTYSDTEMGKFKTSTGAIKTVAYTS